jgi:oligosaccharide translocation protein RFT1
MNEAELVLRSAATGASYNMLLQLAFRALTFLMNAYVLRHISSELLGVVNVRLTLLYTTILFVSREAFRKACLSKSNVGIQWRQTINLLWCTVPLGIVTAVLLSVIWLFVLEQPSTDHYFWGVLAYSLAAVLELCAEPLWVVGQIFLYVRLKVAIEAAATFIRCFVTVILLLLLPQWGLKTFIIAHVSH